MSAWPDALAFVGGLAIAWFGAWQTTDLVWSLWLSSLLVGFALIVWQVSEPLREIVRGMWTDRGRSGLGWRGHVGGLAIVGAGTLFGLGFYALHFGGFHYGHSVFLEWFFPVQAGTSHFPNLGTFAEVFRRYWWFVPVAALAERQAFRRTYREADVSVTPEAIAKRKAKGDPMMAPYKNVIRLHLLIFFFFAAHFVRLENFAVYAVVYAVYFFPWRLLRREPVISTAA